MPLLYLPEQMTDMHTITSYASVKAGKALLNGSLFLESNVNGGFHDFSRLLYRKLNLQYPKFFKMDNLCKLALLTSEMMWQENDITQVVDGSRLAIILGNRASSLDTDRIFMDSIADAGNYFPAPAVFVYTLPNIMIGEICIKKKITGENAFFIFDRFDAVAIFDVVEEMLVNKRAEACLCGWCDYDNGNADAFFMLVEKKEIQNNNELFTIENIVKLYKQIE